MEQNQMNNPNPGMQQPGMPPQGAQEDKTVAILAYCTLLGFIIAIILHSSNKTKLGAYHLRQALGLFITGVALVVVVFILMFIVTMISFGLGAMFGFLMPLVGMGMFVLLILGIVNAANGKMAPVPLIGGMFEKMFGGAFN